MSRIYSWYIDSLENVSVVPDKPKLVVFVHAVLTARETLADGSVLVEALGGAFCVHEGNGTDIENFTEYSSLTPETVMGWLMSDMCKAGRDALQARVDSVMDNRKLTSVDSPPWLQINPQTPAIENETTKT
jgi:hypothetical protein